MTEEQDRLREQQFQRHQKFRDLERALVLVERAEELIQQPYVRSTDAFFKLCLEEMVDHVRGMKISLSEAVHHLNNLDT